MNKHIVKRKGHTEPYDEKKLYASVYAVCIAAKIPTESSELVSEKVVHEVNLWLQKKHEVTANDIRRQASKHLETYNPDAARMLLRPRLIRKKSRKLQ